MDSGSEEPLEARRLRTDHVGVLSISPALLSFVLVVVMDREVLRAVRRRASRQEVHIDIVLSCVCGMD